ncbi:MAG TPA: hypothetical protein VHK91_08930 [Flavisolibacter sp.]|jgi:hypothetical protein|nr:hypothetical protein [Flavisolibacter sp.]
MKWTGILTVILLAGCGANRQTVPVADDSWKRDSTVHFQMQAQSMVRSATKLSAVGQQLEVILKEELAFLKEDQAPFLQVYFLKDRETLTSYTGFPANGYTDTEKGILYFVDKEPFHLALRHELMHALSWRFWGPPKGYWLSEGIAVTASRTCGGYSVHELSHAIQQQGKIVPFQTLADTFDFRALEPSLQSASLVTYIHERFGIAALKGFWQQGLGASEKITGISSQDLERQWLDYIRQDRFQKKVNWKGIRESGCE